jgi:hypothetical protein
MSRTISPDRLSPAQDEVYAALMQAHDGLSETQSHALNARLVLLMANHIGDLEGLRDLLTTARSYADE